METIGEHELRPDHLFPTYAHAAEVFNAEWEKEEVQQVVL